MNYYLVIAGLLSLLASVLHLLIIYKGTSWLKYFHAGEKLVKLSEQGSQIPNIVTFFIASVLFIWALYAFSGAHLIRALPLLFPALIIIASLYLLRGLAVIPLYFLFPEKADGFMLWSSIVSFIFGLFYLMGIVLNIQ